MISVPVMSLGIRSGVNWMRLKRSDIVLRQGPDHQRLGQAGHADQEAVAAGEDRDQELVDDLVLADDHLRHLVLERAEGLDEALRAGQIVRSCGHVSLAHGSPCDSAWT